MMGHGHCGAHAYEEWVAERRAARKRIVRHALAIAWLIIVCLFLAWIVAGNLGFDLVTAVQDIVTAIVASPEPVDMPVPPCVTEDAPGPCYWDADLMGNGTGDSFTVDTYGNVTYWTED